MPVTTRGSARKNGVFCACEVVSGHGLFAGMDGGGVAADVAGDLLSIVGFYQRLVNRLW
jgi:hypothetical protein